MPPRSPSPESPETSAPPADSSAASSTGSSPFVGDTGPGFDPNAGPDTLERDVPELPPVTPAVSEEQVRSTLLNIGDGLHAAIGVGEYDWAMTERDLERIAGPATRIANRHEQIRQVAAHSDEAAVAIGMGLWSWRSMLERGAVKRSQRAAEPEPAPQAPAPARPPAGPEADAGLNTPPGYITYAERLAATRPEGDQ